MPLTTAIITASISLTLLVLTTFTLYSQNTRTVGFRPLGFITGFIGLTWYTPVEVIEATIAPPATFAVGYTYFMAGMAVVLVAVFIVADAEDHTDHYKSTSALAPYFKPITTN